MSTYPRGPSIFARGHWVEPATGLEPRVIYVVCPDCIAPVTLSVPSESIVDGNVTKDVCCACCGRSDIGATLTGLSDPPPAPPPEP